MYTNHEIDRDAFIRGNQPRYVQLANTLINEIIDGKYQIGDLLPTEQDMCVQFGVSRFTVREALKKLVQSGLVTRQPGVGSKVISTQMTTAYSQNIMDISDFYRYATDTSLVIQSSEIITITAEQADMLEGSAGETWLFLIGNRFSEKSELPISYTEIWINPAFRAIKGIMGKRSEAIHSEIEKQFGETVVKVEQTITATSLTKKQANALQVKSGSPSLCIARKYRNRKGELIELSISHHPETRFSYNSVFVKNNIPA